MSCWLCKKSEGDFKKMNVMILSEIDKRITEITEEIKKIKKEQVATDKKTIESKHLGTKKGRIKKELKKLIKLEEILEGKFYEFNILELRNLPESISKFFANNPSSSIGEMEICHYCKTIMEQISEHKFKEKYKEVRSLDPFILDFLGC
jgi:hypothetical protein